MEGVGTFTLPAGFAYTGSWQVPDCARNLVFVAVVVIFIYTC